MPASNAPTSRSFQRSTTLKRAPQRQSLGVFGMIGARAPTDMSVQWGKYGNLLRNLGSIGIIICFYGSASVVYYYLEGWDILTTCYFTTLTISTVGYGDISPQTTEGRVFSIFFVLTGLAVIFDVLSKLAGSIISAAQERVLEAADDDLTDNHKPHKAKLAFSFTLLLVSMFMGALFVFFNDEVDNFSDAMWWAVQTVTTIGYGDIDLKYDSSRWFCIFYVLLSVLLVATALGNLGAVRDEIAQEKKEEELLARMDFTMLLEMDSNGDGVDMNEYLVGMIQMMHLIDPDKLEVLKKQFHHHDKDGSGFLHKDDLQEIAAAQQEEATKKMHSLQRQRSARNSSVFGSLPGAGSFGLRKASIMDPDSSDDLPSEEPPEDIAPVSGSGTKYTVPEDEGSKYTPPPKRGILNQQAASEVEPTPTKAPTVVQPMNSSSPSTAGHKQTGERDPNVKLAPLRNTPAGGPSLHQEGLVLNSPVGAPNELIEPHRNSVQRSLHSSLTDAGFRDSDGSGGGDGERAKGLHSADTSEDSFGKSYRPPRDGSQGMHEVVHEAGGSSIDPQGSMAGSMPGSLACQSGLTTMDRIL